MLKIVLTVAIVAGGIGLVIASSSGDVQYYKMVDELMVEPDNWTGKTMKVHGWVEAGSIDERISNQQVTRTFVLHNKGKRLEVEHKGPKPDTFKDLSEVVAEGQVVQKDGRYVLVADNLMAKCPSKYEGAESNRNAGTQRKVY
ncbi:cytochrome c maturation protein CcmE [Haliangium sp.]|uniref:cytochrome c maturation protein CcmE n=1 Tax=Haliangium sp. TaxID=2663208 RepID=UPI003D0DF113